jgi:TPR repeat protein
MKYFIIVWIFSIQLLLGAAPMAKSYAGLKNQCSAGNKCSCWKLGDYYRDGLKVKLSITKAIQSYEKGCRLGCPYGCLELGNLYFRGVGVKYDTGLAQTHYTKSCMLGNSESCQRIKEIESNVTLPDKNAEVGQFAASCNPNNTHACYSAGYAYMVGGEVVQNIPEGLKFLQKACDFQHNKSCTIIQKYTGRNPKKSPQKETPKKSATNTTQPTQPPLP